MWGVDRKICPKGHCSASWGFAERCWTMIRRDRFFYVQRTSMMDSFSCIPFDFQILILIIAFPLMPENIALRRGSVSLHGWPDNVYSRVVAVWRGTALWRWHHSNWYFVYYSWHDSLWRLGQFHCVDDGKMCIPASWQCDWELDYDNGSVTGNSTVVLQ